MATESTVQTDVTKVETAVKADVTKVESAIKADIAPIQADESKLSRTQLAWAGAAAGFVAFPIVYEILKHLL